MDGLFTRRVGRLVWIWEHGGGPGRLEEWTARRPRAVAAAHGLVLAAALTGVGVTGRVGPATTAAVVIAYTTVVYLHTRERNVALRRFLTTGDVSAAVRGTARARPMSEPKHPAPTSGPCGPGCWCSASPTQAARCD